MQRDCNDPPKGPVRTKIIDIYIYVHAYVVVVGGRAALTREPVYWGFREKPRAKQLAAPWQARMPSRDEADREARVCWEGDRSRSHDPQRS